MTGDIIAEGQTRIDQHAALNWTWIMLRSTPKKKAIARIEEMLSELSHGTNVDFESLIKGLNKEASS